MVTVNAPPGALVWTMPWHALCSDNRKYMKGYVLSDKYRDAKALTSTLALRAARQARWVRPEGPVGLHVAIREPDARRRDLNWAKALKDAITASGAVWWDDSQVRWELWWFEPRSKEHAGATVTVYPLDTAFP
jgi:Holliday junction resolvase RusA-like endonuclease